jgi:hypothetical protein
MLILVFFGILTAIGIIISVKTDWEYIEGIILTVLSGIIFVTIIITLPLSFVFYHQQILQYNIFKDTLEKAREKDIDIENAAILMKIAEWNEWIVGVQYWNTIFIRKDFIPDEVMELQIIE